MSPRGRGVVRRELGGGRLSRRRKERAGGLEAVCSPDLSMKHSRFQVGGLRKWSFCRPEMAFPRPANSRNFSRGASIQQFLSQATHRGGISRLQTSRGIAVLSLGFGSRCCPVLVTVLLLLTALCLLQSSWAKCPELGWAESNHFHSAPLTWHQYSNFSITGFSSLGTCQSFTLVCIFLSLQMWGERQFIYVYSN